MQELIPAVGFHAVTEGVAEIQKPPSAKVVFIFRYDIRLHPDTGFNHFLNVPVSLLKRIEQIRITQHCIFDDFGEAGVLFSFRQRIQCFGVTQHCSWLIECANLVFRSRKIYRCLSADRRINSCYIGRRDLNIRDAALISRCSKSCQIAGNTAAKCDQAVRARHSLLCQLV